MDLKELSVAAIRSLGIDMINKANSGHPGMVLGSAPALYTLFTKELNVDPKHSKWFNRDRFVLASGHASALLYTLLHLSGFDLTIEDLKSFRQWGSRTPGHPEVNVTDGVDASSGPLGQGIPMAVGMAMAERFLATKFNKEAYPIVDHYTYVLCGDGDMQEGVTYEAASLAGHLSLGKLIVLYDSNKVTLDGPLDQSFSEDVAKRFEAQGWHVLEVKDGNDQAEIHKAIKKAKKTTFKPSLIIVNTTIGFGSPKQGTNAVHGAPLGKEDSQVAKKAYGYDFDEFYVPEEVYEGFKKSVTRRGRLARNRHNRLLAQYEQDFPELMKEFNQALNGDFEIDFEKALPTYEAGHSDATRNTSNEVINAIAKVYPTFLSGAADLASSTKTNIKGETAFMPGNYNGRNLCFGIREFAMVAIMNGMMLHGGLRVASGGFLVFSDYFKGGLRMASLMGLPIILPLSHDSIAVGEDGPTHQPTEQLQMLRSIVNMQTIHPCDATETVAAWRIAMETSNKPTAIALTRQNVPTLETTSYEGVKHGAYIVGKEINHLDATILASGSEVALAIKTKQALIKEGVDVRVVSVPSFNLFDEQSAEYKESVLPNSCRKRVAVEMSSSFGWHKYVGLDGACVSVEKFGASAPADRVIEEYGFTVDKLVQTVLDLI